MKRHLHLFLSGLLLLFATGVNADVKVNGLTYSLNETNLTATFTTANQNLNVESVTIPATITVEGKTYKVTGFVNAAFQGGKFTSIEWETPTNITAIGDWVFALCNNIEEVELPEGIINLNANRAFGKMDNLKKVTLPATLDAIRDYTFSADPLLNTIVFKGTTPPTTISDGLFRENTVISNISIVVPDGCLETYETSSFNKYNLLNSFSADVTKNVLNTFLTQSNYDSKSYFTRGAMISPTELSDGDFIYIQASSCINNTPFFIKENSSNVCRWAKGADQTSIWKLIATGESYNKNGKTAPTYYLQNVSTGNYLSIPKTGTMTANIEDAAKVAFYGTANPPYGNNHYNAYTDGWIEARSTIVYDQSHDYFLRNDIGDQSKDNNFGGDYSTHNWMWNLYKANNYGYSLFCNEIEPYCTEILVGCDPGLTNEESGNAYIDALNVAKSISNESTSEEMATAKANLIVAYNNLTTNPITEGYYFIATAGKGMGYSGYANATGEYGPYDYEDRNALYNEGTKVRWKTYTKDASQLYYLTSDNNGNWYVKNIATNNYINKPNGSYGTNISTSSEPETAQVFTQIKPGKYVMCSTSESNRYAYSMASGNGVGFNGSMAEDGDLSNWGTLSDTQNLTFGGINTWFLHKVSAEEADKLMVNVEVTDGVATFTAYKTLDEASYLAALENIDKTKVRSIDLSAVNVNMVPTQVTNPFENTNTIFYMADDYAHPNEGINLVTDGKCPSLILVDKEDFVPAKAFVAKNATYLKTGSLDTEGWYSVVLPFDYVVDASLEVLNNAVVKDATIAFSAVEAGETIPAGTPFIYKSKDGGPFSILQINVNCSVAANATPSTSGALKGTYTKIAKGSATGKLILNAAGSAFATATANASIPAFRAYLDAVAGSNTFTITINDDLTGIVGAGTDLNTKVDVYTIDGKLVRQGVEAITALQGLEKGTYIVNGTKIKK